jgi:RimJ/RimL family protein N-acetyltransferase
VEVTPIVLNGRLVRLEPLSLDHVPDLTEAGSDEAVWRLMPYGTVTTVAQMADFVRHALEWSADRPFAVIHRETGRAVGSTRYLDIRPSHRGLEIGGTWYAPAHQRTGVNTECKYLLLRHAFETLGCIRVQFKTDARNERSQRAIERIGAVQEGVLRNHMILPDGQRRASVMYSITDSEWLAVRARFERLIARES